MARNDLGGPMRPGTSWAAAYGGTFWRRLEAFVQDAEPTVDRPKGTAHPRFPEYVYPVDYGYLVGTQGGDGEGVDVWRGTGEPRVVGIVATLDPFKKNAEIKVLYSCQPAEIKAIETFYENQPQAALLVLRTSITLDRA